MVVTYPPLKCCTPYAAVEATVVDATSQLHEIEKYSGLEWSFTY